MSKDMWLRDYMIAHRGLHDHLIDENSKEAFLKGIDEGFALECDVHLTKDEKVVIHHDKTTKRMMNENIVISETNYSELKLLKHNKSAFPMMLLEDLTFLTAGRVPLLIEIKYNQKRGRLLDEKVAKILDHYSGKFAIQSFDPLSVNWFRKNREKFLRGFLIDKSYDEIDSLVKRVVLKSFLFLPFCKPDFIGLYWGCYKDILVTMIRKFSNLPFVAWTVTTKAAFLECERYFDSIIFENKYIFEGLDNVEGDKYKSFK